MGPRRRGARALASARALPSPNPGPARQGRTPRPLSARYSFQDELSAKSSEPSPERVALPQRDSGAPPGLPGGAAGAKAEEAPSQIRPAARTGGREGARAAPPHLARPPARAHVDPELERACPSRRSARARTPQRARPTRRPGPRTRTPLLAAPRPAPPLRAAPLSPRPRPAPAPAPSPACARARPEPPAGKVLCGNPARAPRAAGQAGTTSSAQHSSQRLGGITEPGGGRNGVPVDRVAQEERRARSSGKLAPDPSMRRRAASPSPSGGRTDFPPQSPTVSPSHSCPRKWGPNRPRGSQTSTLPTPRRSGRPGSAGSCRLPTSASTLFAGRRALRDTLATVRREPKASPPGAPLLQPLPALWPPFPWLSSGF